MSTTTFPKRNHHKLDAENHVVGVKEGNRRARRRRWWWRCKFKLFRSVVGHLPRRILGPLAGGADFDICTSVSQNRQPTTGFMGSAKKKNIYLDIQAIDKFREEGKWEDAFEYMNNNCSDVELQSIGLVKEAVEGEARLDEGRLQDADRALKKALAIDGGNEQAKALWGRLKYEEHDYEGALEAFRGLDLTSVKNRLRSTVELLKRSKKTRSKAENARIALTPHCATVLLYAFVCRAKCLDQLDLPQDGADVCKEMIQAIEEIFPDGFAVLPVANWASAEFRELILEASVLLPRLHRKAGQLRRAINAYRHALVSPLSLSSSLKVAIQKELALELLYGGCEAPPLLNNPELLSDGSQSRFTPTNIFTPSNNTEEAVLLLLLAQHSGWDPVTMEHLCFALSTCAQCGLLAQLYEETMPGVYSRPERWYSLALSHLGAGNTELASNVTWKALRERPDDVPTLLLAGKMCACNLELGDEGIDYAEAAVKHAVGSFEYLKGKAYHVLGVVLGLCAKKSLSDTERQKLQGRALQALHEAVALEPGDSNALYDLALQYAEVRRIVPALQYARDALEWSGGAYSKAWRLVALLLSAQQRCDDAIEVCNAGLDEVTNKNEEGLLLRTAAKIQVASGQYKMALDTYKRLLGLLQIQTKRKLAGQTFDTSGTQGTPLSPSHSRRSSVHLSFKEDENEGVREADVWMDLAQVYIALRQWDDAYTCVDHPSLSRYEPEHWYVNGLLEEAQEGDNIDEALSSYENALAMDPSHAPSMIRMGVLHCQTGGESLPLARSFLTDALHEDPTDHVAWHTLGLVHKQEGRKAEAADCFSAAVLLQSTAPAMSFSSLQKGL